jgi:predicted aspartyl protease
MPEIQAGFQDAPDGSVKGSHLLTLTGPTIPVDIGFDPSYNPAAPTTPAAAAVGVSGLVDTGATESHIDSALAVQLNLPIINRRMIAGSNGAHMVNIHLAQIHVRALNYTIYGEFAAVELAAGGQTHRALLGRTFLRNFTMIYSGATGDVRIFS